MVLSDRVMPTRGGSPLLQKPQKCKMCTAPGKSWIVCSECKSIYHPACLIRLSGMCVDLEGKVHCCSTNVLPTNCKCNEKDSEIRDLRSRLSSMNEVMLDISLRDAERNHGSEQ